MFFTKKILVILVTLCTFSSAYATQTAKQTYESFLFAKSKGKQTDQYDSSLYSVSLNKTTGESPENKLMIEKSINMLNEILSKHQLFLGQTSETNDVHLYYSDSFEIKEGFTEILMNKEPDSWKIAKVTYHITNKLPSQITNQFATNLAYSATKKQFPQIPVHGKLLGLDFKPDLVNLTDKKSLKFSNQQNNIELIVNFDNSSISLINNRLAQSIRPIINPNVGIVTLTLKQKGKIKNTVEPGDFGLQLALSPKNKKGEIPGYIVLQTKDPGTFIEGYFYAK